MRKLIGLLSLFVTLLLAACGGGGGYAGNTGPTNLLRMWPSLGGVTMSVGYFADVAKVTGGVKPFYIGSSAPGVNARLLDDGTIRIETYGPGDGEVWVQDSSILQTKVSFPVKSVVAALTTSVGTAVSLTPGQSQSFTLYGGQGPYTVASTNQAVATVTAGANNSYTITAGNVPGTATIHIVDAFGQTLDITVSNVVATKLAVSPATLTGVAGTSATISVIGGVAPYTVTSSSPSVATAPVSGSTVTVGMVGAGSSTITISSARG